MLSSDLKERVLQFADQHISAQELEEWLVPHLPFYLQRPDTTDADIVAEVELALADLSAGTRDEARIRADLRQAVQPQTVEQLIRGNIGLPGH